MGSNISRDEGSWLAPSELTRRRVVERAGTTDRATIINAALTFGVLALCVAMGQRWALLPLAVLVVVLGLGPVVIRRGARPEYADFGVSVSAFVAVAVAAALSGGTDSPLAYLLFVGIAIAATRGVPRATVVGSVITAIVFVAVCLLHDGAKIVDDPLPMISLLAVLASITTVGVTLSGAEISYRKTSVIDPLTGLLNRHALTDRFEELRQQARLSGAPISLILFDLDHFKAVNDTYGHDVGDAVLRDVAYEVRKNLRMFELVYRIGGEEFLVVLPGLGVGQAELTAEQIRSTIEQLQIHPGIGVTGSFGVSGEAGEAISYETLYRRADQALYRAKEAGRDQVRTDPVVTA